MLRRDECSLRPITADDLDKLLTWRNSDRIRANMYTDHIISLQEHKAWFERSKQQTTSLHLLFEVQSRPAGRLYFTDIDKKNNISYWGFYLGEQDLPRGCGIALGTLGLEYAFTELDMRKVCGEAFAFNDGSIRFHTRLGFKQEGRLVQHVLKDGNPHDILLFALFQEEWSRIRFDLDKSAFI